MTGFFKRKTYLLILIACFCASLLLFLFSYICYRYALRRKRQKEKAIADASGGSVLQYDTLRFVYNTTVEAQQTNFPLEVSHEIIKCNIPGVGSGSSQSDQDGSEHENVLGNIDLVQPQDRHSQRTSSKSTSECSDVVEERSSDGKVHSKLKKFSRARDVGLGGISVSLFFNTSLETLRVNVIQWYNTGSACLKHAVSPYIKVRMFPDVDLMFFTKTKGKENPVFDEEFSFPLGVEEFHGKSLLFSVCDFDKFSRTSILGDSELKLEDFREVLMLPEGTGELWLNLSEHCETTGNKGEVSYSLQYFPTTGRITLTLVKAKDLNVEEGDTSIAVKVSLLFGSNIVKTNKITYHQSDMRNPTFNESWAFDIPSDVFDETNFQLVVYAYSEEKKRMIGKTVAGSQTTQSSNTTALTQWTEMLSQPRTPVLHWHKLV